MSTRFVFALQAVLEQRSRAERHAQGVLAAAQQERLALEDQLAELKQRVEAERSVARGMMVGRVSARSLREHVAGELGADRRARALALKLAGVQKRLEKARESLKQASIQREAIEMLRDRQYAAWKGGLEKADQSEVDDLMVMRRGREEGRESE